MSKLKCNFRRNNGCSVRIENSFIRDNCSVIASDEFSFCTSQPSKILIFFCRAKKQLLMNFAWHIGKNGFTTLNVTMYTFCMLYKYMYSGLEAFITE